MKHFVRDCIWWLLGMLTGLSLGGFICATAHAEGNPRCIDHDVMPTFSEAVSQKTHSVQMHFEGAEAQSVLNALNAYGDPTDYKGTEVWGVMSPQRVLVWVADGSKPICGHIEFSIEAWVEILKAAQGQPA